MNFMNLINFSLASTFNISVNRIKFVLMIRSRRLTDKPPDYGSGFEGSNPSGSTKLKPV